jgi:predicted secreted protein
MRVFSMVAIYVLFWAFSVFLVLPFGVRTQQEAGGEIVPGSVPSAPHEFSLRRVLVRTTIVGTILFALFMANYHFGWFGAHLFDVFDPMNSQ